MRMILPTRPTPCQSTERSTLFEVTFRAGNLVIQERHAVRFNERFGYAYDAAMTMSKASNNVFQQSFNVNSLNAITNTYRAGTLTLAGTTTRPATNVTVNATNAILYADNTFAFTNQPLVDGTNSFPAIAKH